MMLRAPSSPAKKPSSVAHSILFCSYVEGRDNVNHEMQRQIRFFINGLTSLFRDQTPYFGLMPYKSDSFTPLFRDVEQRNNPLI